VWPFRKIFVSSAVTISAFDSVHVMSSVRTTVPLTKLGQGRGAADRKLGVSVSARTSAEFFNRCRSIFHLLEKAHAAISGEPVAHRHGRITHEDRS
jgi:hypothetical protein